MYLKIEIGFETTGGVDCQLPLPSGRGRNECS